MFDISWTEFLLIGIVALVVIGPKELPGVMRTMGQWTRKMRSMAADFQSQFHEAMREAEMADLKTQVDAMARDIKNYDPLKPVREDIESLGEVGKDFEKSLDSATAPNSAAVASAAEATATAAPAQVGAPDEAALLSAAPVAEIAPPTPGAPLDLTPEPAAADPQPGSTERTG